MILDLSHYQGSIDWEQLSPELEFVILRATCGMAKDNRYSEYADNCKKYKVAYGTYHYLKASDEKTALEEADFFYKTASLKDPLFYVIDLEHENQNSSNSEIIVQTFAESLRAKGVGKIGLYANRKYPYVKNIINIFDFIWVPRYGKDTGHPDAENYPPKYPCDLWQYTSKGTAPGIRGYVDKNQLYGDKPLEWFIERKGENNMATIKEVAELANVSVPTVYKVFDENYTTTDEIRKRVLKASKELDYRPRKNRKTYRDSKTVAIIYNEFQDLGHAL